MKDNDFFLEAFNKVRGQKVNIAKMPVYGPTHLTLTEANTLPWRSFAEKMQPLARTISVDKSTEFILIPKNINWTTHDLSIFAGELNDNGTNSVVEFTDFSLQTSIDMFRLHLNIADQLASQDHDQVQFTFGYNPLDYSPGHHSLKRFHTHLRSLGHQIDEQFVKTTEWRDTNWFERLTLIEPFSVLYYDTFVHLLSKGLFSNLDPRQLYFQKGGYLSIDLNKPKDIALFSSQFRNLYIQLKTNYTEVESIYTDKEEDVKTGRYLPVDVDIRAKRLDAYLQTKKVCLSEQSVSLLKYLAKNLKNAKCSGTSNEIAKASEVLITKGFAGGFSFTTSRVDSNKMKMDFFPRVITTTGPTKNLFGDGRCLGFNKIDQVAPSEAVQASVNFQLEVKNIFEQQLLQ